MYEYIGIRHLFKKHQDRLQTAADRKVEANEV